MQNTEREISVVFKPPVWYFCYSIPNGWRHAPTLTPLPVCGQVCSPLSAPHAPLCVAYLGPAGCSRHWASLFPWWPRLHASGQPQYLEEVSGCAPQDLQDSNDELQAAVEGLRAQLPQSWRDQPHAQPNGRLLSRHGRTGRSQVLGGGSDVLLLEMVGAVGFYLPLLLRLPLVPGSTVLGRPASQHIRPSPASRWSRAPPTAHVGEGPAAQGWRLTQHPEPRERSRRARALPFE